MGKGKTREEEKKGKKNIRREKESQTRVEERKEKMSKKLVEEKESQTGQNQNLARTRSLLKLCTPWKSFAKPICKIEDDFYGIFGQKQLQSNAHRRAILKDGNIVDLMQISIIQNIKLSTV